MTVIFSFSPLILERNCFSLQNQRRWQKVNELPLQPQKNKINQVPLLHSWHVPFLHYTFITDSWMILTTKKTRGRYMNVQFLDHGVNRSNATPTLYRPNFVYLRRRVRNTEAAGHEPSLLHGLIYTPIGCTDRRLTSKKYIRDTMYPVRWLALKSVFRIWWCN